jgi:hypothetical protein
MDDDAAERALTVTVRLKDGHYSWQASRIDLGRTADGTLM